MPKYVLVYKGGGVPEGEAEQQKVMAAWGAWYGQLGAAVADGGNPFGPSAGISTSGDVTEGAPSGLSGYTIINAENLQATTEMAKGCRVRDSGGSIEVYETLAIHGNDLNGKAQRFRCTG